jgi:retinol dehydrogenase 12
VSLHPGVVTTEIWRNLEKMPFLSILIVLFKPLIWFTFKNCKEGAQTTLHCALDDDEVLKNNGKYFTDCRVSKISTEAKNENAEKLWNVSLALTGLDK